MRITILPARTIFDALAMRRIRNESRDYMTRNQNEIGFFEQVCWFYWILRKSKTMEAHILRADGKRAGYGFLKQENGKWWVTGIVTLEYRTRGIGRLLFDSLTQKAISKGGESWLEVWDWNVRARMLYESLGYEYQNYPSRVLVMRRKIRNA